MRCALPAALAGHQTGPDEDQVGQIGKPSIARNTWGWVNTYKYHLEWRGWTMMNTSQLFGCEQKDKGVLTPYANFFWPSVLRCSHEAKLVMAWLWYLHVWRWSSSGRMPYPMICRQVEERMLGWPRMEIFVATPGSFFLVHWFCTYDSERDFICGCWSLVLSMQHKKCCWWSHLKGKIALKWRPHCGMGQLPLFWTILRKVWVASSELHLRQLKRS